MLMVTSMIMVTTLKQVVRKWFFNDDCHDYWATKTILL